MIPRLLQSAESWCGLIPRKQFAVNPAGAGCQDPGYGRRAVTTRAPNEGSQSFTEVLLSITKKAPTRAFSWLKAPTSILAFKTLLCHYVKQVLTQSK